jgi:hypothetical protein
MFGPAGEEDVDTAGGVLDDAAFGRTAVALVAGVAPPSSAPVNQ